MPLPLGTATHSPVNDPSTLARTSSRRLSNTAGVPLGTADRVAEAMHRAIPLLPPEAQAQVRAMLSPESLGIVCATLLAWVGSHLFGVGEIVDLILLGVGVALLGLSVFTGAQHLYEFAVTAANARSDDELNRAAREFAAAVTILGISVISALLLRRSLRATASAACRRCTAHRTSGRHRPQVHRPGSSGPFRCRMALWGKPTGGETSPSSGTSR